jgi:hypothetical protein
LLPGAKYRFVGSDTWHGGRKSAEYPGAARLSTMTAGRARLCGKGSDGFLQHRPACFFFAKHPANGI